MLARLHISEPVPNMHKIMRSHHHLGLAIVSPHPLHLIRYHHHPLKQAQPRHLSVSESIEEVGQVGKLRKVPLMPWMNLPRDRHSRNRPVRGF